MKVIVAGSRSITDYQTVAHACDSSLFEITEIVSGKAKGVDSLGEEWAANHNIPVKDFPANWNQLGRKAGPLRNIQMAEYADALIAVWDGQSKGTEHMIHEMEKRNKPVEVFYT